MRRSDNPMEDPNRPDDEPEYTVERWREVHDSGQPHDESRCPWCDYDDIAEAKTEPSEVPLDNWEVWPVMDSVEYMDRPVPIYQMEDGTVLQGTKVIGKLNADGEMEPVDEA